VRLKSLTVEQVLDRLGSRFDMLAGRDVSAPEHHRTLRATLAWSRALLSEEERVLWHRASVFATGFDLVAAEAICSGDGLPAPRVMDALDGLVDKSIVTASRAGTSMRYRLLETVREYGLHELRVADEDRDLQARMFGYYAELCRQAWDNWATEAQPEAELARSRANGSQ
jgi:predicted ATPase